MTKFIKNDTIWRIFIGLVGAILVGIGGWGLHKVAAMPEIYITKDEAIQQKVELSKQICDLKTDVNTEIGKVETRIHNRITASDTRSALNQTKLENKLDKINDLILEHMTDGKKDKVSE